MEVVLASASPRRKTLLEQLHFVVETKPVIGIDETPPSGVEVRLQVETICRRKADGCDFGQDEIIIVADTMIEHPNDSNKSIGKPEGLNHAREILSLLSGQTHKVWTTTGIFSKGKWHMFTNEAVVFIPSLDDEMMIHLLDSGSWQGKAGAYDLHGEMQKFATLKHGEESTVLGIASEAIAFLQSIAEGVI
jgi:septum formation protein